MKLFSKVKETRNVASKLRLCFEFKASEDPTEDLHSAGLLVSMGVSGWHGAKERSYSGRVYVETDKQEDLEKAQEQLNLKGWTEVAE